MRVGAAWLENVWGYWKRCSLVILPAPEGKLYGRGAEICAAWDAAMQLPKTAVKKPRKKVRKTSD